MADSEAEEFEAGLAKAEEAKTNKSGSIATSHADTMQKNQEKFSRLLENASKSSIFMTEYSSDNNESFSAHYKFDHKQTKVQRVPWLLWFDQKFMLDFYHGPPMKLYII